MGQANKRGTPEQRKEQAIKEGREKLPKLSMRKLKQEILKDLIDPLSMPWIYKRY